ncbi:CD91 [Mytilus edulis]|uniref:LRP1 n=1 Tax=Mytilus edulis TaxID=6550 RepID=A0A8S3T131_MYTED|nr:CD91 [Mytilus edulis]
MGISFGLAVDWINDHIYWTDGTFQSIQVVDLQGGNRITLIDYLIEKPRSIAVHPSDGILFFSDWGTSTPRIERCGLDGKDRESIVENVGEPISLTIDRRRSEIKSAKFDGSSIKTVMKNSNYLTDVFGIAIHKDKVYWTNWEKGEILRTDKYASFEVEKVFASSSKTPLGMVVYDGNQQMSLGRNVKVLLTEKGTISSTDIDSGHADVLHVAATSNIVGIDYDYDQQMLFWTDHYNYNIYAYFLFFNDKITAGFGIKRLLPDFVYQPDSIAVDWIYKHIYWTDLLNHTIHVCTFYGAHRKTFVTNNLVYPDALALSPSDGNVFRIIGKFLTVQSYDLLWNEVRERPSLTKGVVAVYGIAVDHQARRIYWTDVILQTIKSATFDGTDVHTILKSATESSPRSIRN